MACPAVHSGDQFLATALAHVDCQAQTIGTYGFAALAGPNSPVTLAMTALLTIFVALWGIRLLAGVSVEGRDLVSDILRVGIVLALASSWPVWRVIAYDVVIHGPNDIGRVIGAGTRFSGSDLADRLQQVDQGLAALNVWGSGRPGVAQGDWFQLGLARSSWLLGTLAPLALIRLMAGILLALAPLMAGLLLFRISRPIFDGWARALVLCFLGSLVVGLLLTSELALIEPWLQGVLEARAVDSPALEAPVEIAMITSGFALICFLALGFIARIAFHPTLQLSRTLSGNSARRTSERFGGSLTRISDGEPPRRAQLTALAISQSMAREHPARNAGGVSLSDASGLQATRSERQGLTDRPAMLGDSYRRSKRRISGAARRRDGQA